VERLRVPLWVNTIYLLLVGIATFSPGFVSSIFGYEVKDAGVLLVLSASLLGTGVIFWGIAGDPAKHGSLASVIVLANVIAIVFMLWGWTILHLFTLRSVGVPLVIEVVLAAWIWSARPR